MVQQVLEGTWEEIRAHERELAGQRVRLTFLRPELPSQPPQVPPVIYDPSSDSILTNEIRDVLEPFIALLLADIQQYAIDASKVEIWGTEDPEGGRSQIMVLLWLNCESDDEMWHYYEDFCARVDKWLRSLGDDRRILFLTNIWITTRRVKNA